LPLQIIERQQQEVGMRLIVGVLSLAAVLAATGVARADEDGEKVFKKYCTACHTVEPGKNKIGPSLSGVVGRKAGTAPGFQYSDAMKNSGITWSDEELEKYLADPKATVPGNKMAFAGVKKADERKAVIEFLDKHKQSASAAQ
jgi:cytochrome c